MTLESSESEFTAQFAEFAATGTLYAQQEGSPLMEFASGGRVLYLFDRCGPYSARPGSARVVVHGVLDPEFTRLLEGHGSNHEEALAVLGVSALEGVGRLLGVKRGSWVVQARMPLILAALEPALLPRVLEGDWVSFRTIAPLHGFVVHD